MTLVRETPIVLFVLIGLALMLLVPFSSAADEDTYGDVSNVTVESCYDGDTCRFDIPGWPPIVGEDMPVRLAGMDTPEIQGECKQEKQLARQARNAVNERLKNADTIVLHDIQRGKFFRLVARVIVDGEDLSKWLLDKGLARPYEGGERKGWCEEEIKISSSGEPAQEDQKTSSVGSPVSITAIDKEDETVTLRNEGEEPIDLSGWVLVSEKGNQRFEFPNDTMLEPEESLTVTSGRDAEHNPPAMLKWTGAYVWNNDEPDPGVLLNAEGEEISRWPDPE